MHGVITFIMHKITLISSIRTSTIVQPIYIYFTVPKIHCRKIFRRASHRKRGNASTLKAGYFETKFRILCNLCRLCSDRQCGITISGLCYISLYPLLFMFLKVMLMIVCSQFSVIVNIYFFSFFFQ
jgi:hypothetical protein